MSYTIPAGRSLHFAPNLNRISIDSGRNVLLQCILSGDSNHGESFLWTGPAIVNESDRVYITLDSSGTVSTLSIRHVVRSDEGRYFCSYTDVGVVSIILDVVCKPIS